MDAKHTPGPWMSQGLCYEGEERGSCCIVGENLGGLVAAALPWTTELDEGDFPRVEANARLIAAAPDMLAALREARSFMMAPAEDLLWSVIGRLDAAISKAETE